MSDIRIEVVAGAYDDDEAYNSVIGYITNKSYFCGYGFYCYPEHTIIEQFKLSETNSHHTNDQKIWHFYITFSERWKHGDLLNLGNQISLLFASKYQIVYGLDIKESRPHLHFGVNAFSYHPDTPILSTDRMHNCMINLQNLLNQWYPHKTVTLQFQGKRD